jgi:hypothetical protein
MVSLTPRPLYHLEDLPRFPSYRRLYRRQSRSGRCREEKKLLIRIKRIEKSRMKLRKRVTTRRREDDKEERKEYKIRMKRKRRT